MSEPCVRIERVTKRFGEFAAVDAVSLEIHRGEIFCLLGGSGSGKTTLLRMLAGFERPSSGRIYIDGRDMSEVAPHARPVNMMFQSYALFPHMTVERNVAFGLEQERISRPEIRRRVGAMLELVRMEPYAGRKPHQLSGGQRQRVALARALVKRPKLLLLDEPLAALDRKLREHTQFELINIHERLGVTFIVVTHDQQEAMALSSRMGVMSQGRIVQIGTPAEIYERPATRLVADFIGTVNLFEGRVVAEGSSGAPAAGMLRILCAELGEVRVSRASDAAEPGARESDGRVAPGATVCIAIRPERIVLERAADDAEPTRTAEASGRPVNRVDGTVREVGYRGDVSVYLVELASGRVVRVTRPNVGGAPFARDEAVRLSWQPSSPIVLTR